jgi:hypothetical protein
VGSWIAIAAAAAVVGAAGVARADVTWEAPAACPDRARMVAAIEAELGRPLDAAAVDVAGRVEPAGSGWRVTLRLGSGERVVEARTCADLVATGALIVALAIDAGEAAAPPPPPPAVISPPLIAPATDGETPPPRALGLPPTVTTAAPPPPPPSLDLRMRAAFGGASGGLPTAGGGFGGGIELARGPWSIDASAARWLSQRADNEESRGAELTLTTVGLRGCRALVETRGWRVAACAGAELDALRARPYGFLDPAPAQTLVGGGVSVGAAVVRRIAGPLWVRLDGEATVLIRTVTFREGDPEMPDMLGVTVHEMGRSILRVLAAAEVRIP